MATRGYQKEAAQVVRAAYGGLNERECGSEVGVEKVRDTSPTTPTVAIHTMQDVSYVHRMNT